MKKINIILHETTIINFPFFWKLMKRYSYFTIVLPIIVFSISLFNYSSQKNIFQRDLSFKYNTGDVDSPTNAIATLIGEKTGVMTEAQIIGMINSLDFQKHLADKVIAHPELYQLNLSPVNNKKSWDMDSHLASCQKDNQCMNVRLRGLIAGKVAILPDPNIENHFILRVTTLDEKSTNILLEETSKLIIDTRVSSIKKQLSDQLSVSKSLKIEKEKELSDIDYDKLLGQKRNIAQDLKATNVRLNSLYNDYRRTKEKLSLMETRYVETKRVASSDVTLNDKAAFEARKKLEKKIKNLKSDIWAVEKSTDKKTAQDNAIIAQLQKDLAKAKRDLKKMGARGRRSVASQGNYLNQKTDESNYVEFDYNVMKKQYVTMKKDYKALNVKKDKLSNELNAVAAKVDKLEPTMEYIKLITSKIMQLTLLESTVISDLVFEKEFGGTRVFKKTTKSKVIIFSLVLATFLVMVCIILRYLFDDRIFDRVELEKSFEELSIIGNTPDFD